ncbi:MAG: hypothetical protein FJ100_10825 [Deltaproteobacteria bacterium]|nr:hypothetical protein [Deltaproteobacteria bacterium]
MGVRKPPFRSGRSPLTVLPLALALAIAGAACTVQVNQQSGFDPCNPNPCQSKGVCGGWTGTCAVKSNLAVCSAWKWTAKTAVPKDAAGKALTKPEGYEGNEITCDAKDNDCDGQTDEGVVGDPAKVCATQGVCAGSKPALLCLGGQWLCGYAALPAYQASETTCDGKDNDCDGQTDEAVQPKPLDCKRQGVCAGLPAPVCAGAAGWDCGYVAAPDYEATETKCDGLDNDCDGQADSGLGTAALAGKATCKTAGVCAQGSEIVCAAGQPACSYAKVAGFEALESTCDGQDNDCDGQTDTYPGSALPLHATTTEGCAAKGVCSAAGAVARLCKAGVFACDYAKVQAYEAKETLCDGKDNDCDGQIDNFATAPKVAACGTKGVCADGPLLCSASLWQCDWSAMTAKGYEAFEATCDGKDNDCDGLTDESASATKGCKTAGVCQWGTDAACKDGKIACDYSHISTYQDVTETLCDGLDNDCDGQTDEPEALDPSKAGCALGVCQGTATASCEKGKWVCDTKAAAGYEAEEKTCDGKDNDCDGLTDEGLVNPGACAAQGVCSAGVASVCAGGKFLCNYGAVLGYEAVETTCDGKDNDCDGKVDVGVCGPTAACSTADQCVTGACVALVGGSGKVCASDSKACAVLGGDGKVAMVADGKAVCASPTATQACAAGSFGAPQSCSADKPTCFGGACAVCAPSAKSCDPKDKVQVVQCAADGQSATAAGTCKSGERCVGAGDCVPDAPFAASDSAEAVAGHAVVALSGGGFAVIWTVNKGTAGELRGRLFSATGAAAGASQVLNGAVKPSKDSQIAAVAIGTGFAVAWEAQGDGRDIGLGVFDATGKALAAPVVGNDPDTLGEQTEPALAAHAGGLWLAWSGENVDFFDYGIGARAFDATGKPTGATNLVINEGTTVPDGATGDQRSPAVACASNGACAVAFVHVGTNGKGSIRARGITAFGQLATSMPNLSTGSASADHRAPTLAAVAGGYVVAWTAEGMESGGSGTGIAIRPLNANLTAVDGAPPALANGTTAGNQAQPHLRTTATGVALVWSTVGTGSVRDFSAAAAPLGPEANFVTDATASAALWPKVAALADGKGLLLYRSDAKGAAPLASQALFR